MRACDLVGERGVRGRWSKLLFASRKRKDNRGGRDNGRREGNRELVESTRFADCKDVVEVGDTFAGCSRRGWGEKHAF